MWELLIGAIVGGIVGWILNEVFNPLKLKIKKNIKQKILKKSFGNIDFKTNADYLFLDRAIPFYEEKFIDIRESDTKLIIAIPNEYKNILKDYNFEIREEEIQNWKRKLTITFNHLGISNYENLIKETTKEIAEEFINELSKGFIRFNGLMYGIENIRATRNTKTEEAGLDICFYKTDYFTYRVFGRIYQKLKIQGLDFEINKLPDLNKFYTPFLSSFGIANFIIINRGNGDEIIIGQRSNSVVVDKGKLHFSMNEAFSLTDRNQYGQLSFTACLFRGLKEEIGISPTFSSEISEYKFLDLGLELDRFEVGISSFVRINLNDKLTFKKFVDFYNIAQDKELETETLICIPIKNIDTFLKENYSKMSKGSRTILKSLYSRYEAGYLREKN